MLRERGKIIPFGLTLEGDDNVETFIVISESNSIPEVATMIEDGLKSKIKEKNISATSLTYPNYEKLIILTYMENDENYCAKFIVPVIFDNINGEQIPRLDLEGIQAVDGEVFIFPFLNEE